MIKNLLLAFLLLFVSVIVNAEELTEASKLPDITQEAKKITFSKEDGKLILYTPQNKHCLLAIDAIAYEPYVSPDATWIAVETQLLSNLQILRIYHKGTNGCYDELQPTFSEKVWNDLLKNRETMLEDMIHPRIDFLEWTDSNKIKIHISGDLKYDSIDKEFTYVLEDKLVFDENERIVFNRYIDHNETLFFQFEILKNDESIVEASFDEFDYDPFASSKKGNSYILTYDDEYTAKIKIVKKHIEEIEYLSVNVNIYQSGVSKYHFLSDASEYYDRRYPSCSSVHGDAWFYDSVIEILYDKTLHHKVMDLLKTNYWYPVVYAENGSVARVDNSYIVKELCTQKRCKVKVMVPKGEEFHAISLLNGEGNGKICTKRIAAEAGTEMEPMEMHANKKTLDGLSEEENDALSSVDRALKKLKDANIVFDTPSSMDKHKTYIIHLKLNASEDVAELLKELHGSQKESARIKYSSRTKAELISKNKEAFEITPVTPAIQAVSSLVTTTWKWDVTPLESGEQYLHLSLTAFINVEGKETASSVKTFDKRIKVNISLEDEVVTFMQSNWKWILGTLLFPFIGFLWSKVKGKKEDKDKKDDA